MPGRQGKIPKNVRFLPKEPTKAYFSSYERNQPDKPGAGVKRGASRQSSRQLGTMDSAARAVQGARDAGV